MTECSCRSRLNNMSWPEMASVHIEVEFRNNMLWQEMTECSCRRGLGIMAWLEMTECSCRRGLGNDWVKNFDRKSIVKSAVTPNKSIYGRFWQNQYFLLSAWHPSAIQTPNCIKVCSEYSLSSCVVNIHQTLTGRDLRCDFWHILHQKVRGLAESNFRKGLMAAMTAFENPKRSILDQKIFNHWWALHSLAFKV